MTFLNKLLFILLGILAFSCSSAPKTFVEKVEEAHGKSTFSKHSTIAFDLQLFFGGTERFNGRITWATNSSKGKLDYMDGRNIEVNEMEITYSDTSMSEESARFTAYTWSYFFMLPYKLSDPGTQWNDYENKSMNGTEYDVEKLSFESGTGDAPDDCYVVYADKESHLIHVASYIVTAGQSVEEAEKDPHAIKYDEYKEIDGVPIAHKWSFWGWTETEGLTDELGYANLSNICFVEDF
ncbi:MAG: hypothetical protein MK078_03460 [Crocinitomicaceae bacterium]|nr:hypothetical protein [Crocinitomicaceae bacterium]